MKKTAVLLSSLLMAACSTMTAKKIETQPAVPSLPEPIANNAVAMVNVEGEPWVYSFNGLKSGKDYMDVSNDAYGIRLDNYKTDSLGKIPYEKATDFKTKKSVEVTGVLASVAVTVKNQIYLFGGYTVAADHSEISTEDVIRFDPKSEKFETIAKMPTPVDDSVAMVYQDRYIYLVSGWHNEGNVDLVQIFDTQTNKWHQGTAFPGETVFGQGGAILGNQMLVVDGVAVKAVVNGRRKFGMANQSYMGTIDPTDFTKIEWKKLPAHPGFGRYRMAVAADKTSQQIVFVGGSANPYNFNGIGYNGVPSKPESLIFAWDFKASKWKKLGHSKKPTMDHRGLIIYQGKRFTLGGMIDGQKVIGELVEH